MKYVTYILTILLFYSVVGLAIWMSKNPWWCLMTLLTPSMSEQSGKE
jgi:hypothetical protein